MKRLVITDAAQTDLSDIGRYTEREWGAAQRRRYLEAIRARLMELRENPGIGAPRDEIIPGHRSVQSGRHVIFYRETPDSIVIIRVLHERMDLRRHLEPERAKGTRILASTPATERTPQPPGTRRRRERKR